MKKLLLLSLVVMGALWVAACNSGGGNEEPAPKGEQPEIKQAEPGMVPPEQRGGGGGEGDR